MVGGQPEPVSYTYRYRSFFWPAILILGGLIALLVNTGRIPAERLYLLLDLWPLILILIGLELIIRRSLHGASGELAAALVVLLALGGAVAYVALAPNPSATNTMDSSARVGTLEQASLEINVGAAKITVSGSTAIGGDLYHAHIEYSGAKPDVSMDPSTGRLVISQSNSNFTFFQNRRFVLDLQLNPQVHWTIAENSGATTDTLNLSSVHVGSIRLNTGASREEITLGPPSGVVPVEINGGALTVHLHRPGGTAASVSVSGGAVSLTGDGRPMHAIGNLMYESAGFGSASDAYRIRVNGGACTVTLDAVGLD